MHFHCGNNYSQSSIFDGYECINNNCCDHNIFQLKNDYDECVMVEKISFLTYAVYGLIISILCLAFLIVLVANLIKYRTQLQLYQKYNCRFYPPMQWFI